ncbi:hypothetical protein Tco_1376322 [Tanacetum coccineum]
MSSSLSTFSSFFSSAAAPPEGAYAAVAPLKDAPPDDLHTKCSSGAAAAPPEGAYAAVAPLKDAPPDDLHTKVNTPISFLRLGHEKTTVFTVQCFIEVRRRLGFGICGFRVWSLILC